MEAHRERFLSKVEKSDGCWLWRASMYKSGYGGFSYNKDSILSHRFSYCLHNNCELDSIKGLIIRHSCHNRHCVNPSHLSTGTHQDNMDDMTGAGRQAKGEYQWNSKLSEEQVKAIRLSDGLHKDIAAQYGIARSYVCEIKKKKAWKHIE